MAHLLEVASSPPLPVPNPYRARSKIAHLLVRDSLLPLSYCCTLSPQPLSQALSRTLGMSFSFGTPAAALSPAAIPASDAELEAFALGDRAAVVRDKMVPESESHYFFASLLAEQSGFPAALKAATAEWKRRNKDSALVKKFDARKQFAKVNPASPKTQAMAKFSQALGASFTHAQQLPRFQQSTVARLPTEVRGRPPPPSLPSGLRLRVCLTQERAPPPRS